MASAFEPSSNDKQMSDTHRDQSYQPRTPRKSPTLLPLMENSGDLVASVNDAHSSDHPRAISSLYAHLPTPQSPNNIASYIPGLPNTPESPVSHVSHSFPPSARSLAEHSGRFLDGTPKRSPLRSQQIMTPESSPFASRIDAQNNILTPATPTPRTMPSPGGMESLTSSPLRKTPSPSPSIELHSSQLSSPFVAKASVSTRSSRPSSASPNTANENAPSPLPPISSLISTPPISPLLASGSTITPSVSTTPPAHGGELERIHQAMQQQHDAVESRRPEYLKRSKRTLSDADPTALMEDDGGGERDRYSSVGIMDSPMKGRRIKLFQETSEESFEESLMAGGYGRYRTADWVRQPQPIVVASSTGAPVNVVAHLEEVQKEEPSPPPTEKEIRKRKRLDAFRSSSALSSSRLYPVDIEGKGRVLLDVPTERSDIEATAVASKKRTPGKRKRKAEPTAKERRALAAAAAAEESAEKPNWPDTEFPWKLRTEERTEQAKAEEEERLKWIEKFLDRDTDDEDDEDGGSIGLYGGDNPDEEVLPSSVWGVVYEDGEDRPVPYRAGRGKMVPLRGDPGQYRVVHQLRRSAYFPSDPADARAALLSKKSVRALSYRRQRLRSIRRTGDDGGNEGEAALCICRGRDDGREMAQCDSCNTWYHLDCIGIEDVAELGAAEDKWYCYRCEPESDSPPSIETSTVAPEVEPDFAPTDETPHRREADAQLYQPESPTTQSWSLSVSQVPKTPTRGVASSSEFGSGFSSSSSHFPSSRQAPVTPRHQLRDVRVITGSTPGGPYDVPGFDDSQFDPTSTPSRGIKFGGPFTTPKNSLSSRAFQTPSRPNLRGSTTASFGAAGFLSSALNERGTEQSLYTYHRPGPFPVEESSPIRREGHRVRRIADAAGMSASRPLFEESPLRMKGKGRALDFGVEN
ncbi:hypothetical protein GYMLUDRAFT_38606 [Collybiopsis luxurians FD-317 M1]|nr:hypothetical protein GYMLUDRAFT_38606 [Collybiopsis luxurians FD-317 M1]